LKKTIIFIAVLIISIFCFASPLFAFTVKGGEDISVSEEINDDVYAMGNSVSFTGTVNGDFVAAGGQIDIDGAVNGDLLCAGGSINIRGDIEETARIAGGMIVVDADLNHDLLIAGGQIDLKKSSTVKGDVVISGGTVKIFGNIAGNLLISAGQVVIAGSVGGDVEISGGDISFEPGAQIAGDLKYSSSNEAKISDDVKIGGETSWTKLESEKIEMTPETKANLVAAFAAGYIGTHIFKFVGFFILGILLILAFPITFKKFNERIKKSFGFCVGGGAMMLFGIPLGLLILLVLGIVLMLTIIGALVGTMVLQINILLLVAYIILLFVSCIYFSFFLGNLILAKSGKNLEKYGWKVIAYLIGLLITVFVTAIPFLGGVVQFAVTLFGFGGLIMIIKDQMALRRKV